VTPFQVLRNGWSRFSANFGPLVLGHLLALVVLTAATLACVLPYFLVLGPLWYGYALMSLGACRGEKVETGQLFAGFRQEHFGNSLVIGLLFLMAPMAVQLILSVPMNMIMPFYIGPFTTPMNIPRESWPMLLGLAGFSTFVVLAVQLLTIMLMAPAMFVLQDGQRPAWDTSIATIKWVWRDRVWWRKLWAWLAFIHLLGLFTCGIAWLVIHPYMAVVLAEAYELRKPRHPLAGAGAPPPIRQSPPRFP